MKFKEFLKEEKIKFNADNYSGGTITVDINDSKGTFKSKMFSGKFKYTNDNIVTVVVDDYGHAPISVYKLSKSSTWIAEDDELGISRDDENPIVAALKLAANIF